MTQQASELKFVSRGLVAIMLFLGSRFAALEVYAAAREVGRDSRGATVTGEVGGLTDYQFALTAPASHPRPFTHRAARSFAPPSARDNSHTSSSESRQKRRPLIRIGRGKPKASSRSHRHKLAEAGKKKGRIERLFRPLAAF